MSLLLLFNQPTEEAMPEPVVEKHVGGDISTHNRTHVVVMDRDNYGADDEIAAALWEMLNG
jgi:hypothetical protein